MRHQDRPLFGAASLAWITGWITSAIRRGPSGRSSTSRAAKPAFHLADELIDVKDRHDDVGARDQPRTEAALGLHEQVVLAPIEADIRRRLPPKAADEAVDESPALRRLKGDFKRLPPDSWVE